MQQDLKHSVREALDRLRYWERRRDSRASESLAVGASVFYKDEKVPGVVIELLDGNDGRKMLVGRAGAMVSFKGRAAVPVFLWALQHDTTMQ